MCVSIGLGSVLGLGLSSSSGLSSASSSGLGLGSSWFLWSQFGFFNDTYSLKVLSDNFAYNISTNDSDFPDQPTDPSVAAHKAQLTAKKLFDEISDKLTATQHQLNDTEVKLKEQIGLNSKVNNNTTIYDIT